MSLPTAYTPEEIAQRDLLPRAFAVNANILCLRQGWTKDILAKKRQRYWQEGKHYATVGGEIVYYLGEIDRWTEENELAPANYVSQCRLGTVYLIAAPELGRVKIGFTEKAVERRLKALQTSSPTLLEIVADMPGSLADEQDLHQKHSKHHVVGEWFADCPEIRAEFGI